MKVVTRQEAIELGLTRYFTGKPCKWGHVSERITSCRHCITCRAIIGKKWRAVNKDRISERGKKWYANNKDRIGECKKKWRAVNKDRIGERGKKYYAENRDMRREYRREHYKNNKERVLESNSKYREDNRDKIREQVRKYTADNKEKIREYKKKYNKKNRAYYRAIGAKSRAQSRRATPPWVDNYELTCIYERAIRATIDTGTQMNVDHIVPLNHPRVCGLHAPVNLRVITESENMKKGNYHWPAMPKDIGDEL